MTDWLDDLWLEPGPPYLAMGTRALKLDHWLVVDDDRDFYLAQKAALLQSDLPSVFAATPGSEDAGAEVLAEVQAWLSDRGVDIAAPSGDSHPLIEAARLVQEDLAVMQKIEGEWVLTAGAVCFPTHWCIADKVGSSLAGVHGPVAHYENELSAKVDRLHDRLRVDRPVWRRNWVVAPTSRLDLIERGGLANAGTPNVGLVIEPDGSPMWIRSERQTLRRLPRTDAIVFTILVQRTPLGVLLERPDVAQRMLSVTDSWDAEKRMYASTGGALRQLNEWLAMVAHAG